MIYLSLSLKELYLHWNLITSTGFLHLLKYLPDNETLKVLDISNNKLYKNYKKENTQYWSHMLKNNTGLIHLDFSCNKMPETAFEPISEALNGNKTLHGVHVDGNFGGAEIDFRGFMVKTEDSISRKTHGRPRIKSLESVKMNYRGMAHSECWICEGWTVQSFNLDNGDFQDINSGKDMVFLHLEFRNWESIALAGVKSGWKLDLMCPPGRIGYFYSNEKIGVILDKFEETRKFKLKYEDKTSGKTYEIEKINEFHLLINKGLF